LYINGSQITAFASSSYPSQNATYNFMCGAATNAIGSSWDFPSPSFPYYSNCYLTEVNFIDGQALTPSSFGAFDAQTGVWGPTRYAGSYGTNGFYLNFSDSSNTTAATLGKDYSGNGNNWTPNNFSVSAGAGNDSLVDVPTNWGVDTGVGGSVRGNYCTLNPLVLNVPSGTATLSNGNLEVSTPDAGSTFDTRGTIGVSNGKWYWEVVSTGASRITTGIIDASAANNASGTVSGVVYFSLDGTLFYFGSATSSWGASWASGDVIGVALNLDAGTIAFYKNNTLQGTHTIGVAGTFTPCIGDGSGATGATGAVINFGQRPFAYTAPSGFKALNTQNLPTPTIGATTATQAGKYFNISLYTGNNANQSISGLGFQPDFLWFKSRNLGRAHALFNSVMTRGFGLSSNTTGAEVTITAGNDLASFDADGFSLGPVTNYNSTNGSGDNIVAWAWKANGAGVTNTAGSITSTVSANTTSGFSVVTYTGNGTAGATVGHGLGRNVAMYFVKNRSATADWAVLGHALNAAYGNRAFLLLNTTNAFGGAAQGPGNSSTIELWNDSTNNASGNNYVAYCFAEVPGYSRFGNWTGNGSADGPFVFCGFRPAYVMVKNTSGAVDWIVEDGTRNPSNVVNAKLSPNTSGAEFVDASAIGIDFLSNGFKVRGTDAAVNGNGNVYIFAAFASAPQKFSLAR